MTTAAVSRQPARRVAVVPVDRETALSYVLLTYASEDSAHAMRQSIVGNAANQLFVGIELVDVRVLEVSASATSI
jgi:hypothetical protein